METEGQGSEKSLVETHLCDLHSLDTNPVSYILVLGRSPFGCR